MTDDLERIREVERQTENFRAAILPWGWAGINAAIEAAMDAGKDGDWVADQVNEFMWSVGETKLESLDVCYIVYDALLQEARNDINQATDTDIMNDLEESIDVYANYMCTSIDGSDDAYKAIRKIIKKIKKDERTDAIKWLNEQVRG